MKVNELLGEAKGYHKPSVAPLVRKSANGEKTGKLQGSVDDWMGELNKRMKTPITKAHMKDARGAIKASAEYKAITDLGFKDVSSAAAIKNGTFIFSNGKQKFNFLATGKINDRSQYGGGQRGSTLPRIVPGDPHATLVKTMTRSLAHFTSKHSKDK